MTPGQVYGVPGLTLSRRRARGILGLSPGPEALRPGGEGSTSDGGCFCSDISSATDDSCKPGRGGILGVFPGDKDVINSF